MKTYIAGAVAISLFAYELAEGSEAAKFFRVPTLSASESLVPNFHTHSELNVESHINVTNALAASGANGMTGLQCYRLHLLPVTSEDEQGNPKMVRIDLLGISNLDNQHMYGTFGCVEDLTLLTEKLFLPNVQVQTLRANLLAGQRCEVGGHIAALTFPAKLLTRIGMSFRPPA